MKTNSLSMSLISNESDSLAFEGWLPKPHTMPLRVMVD